MLVHHDQSVNPPKILKAEEFCYVRYYLNLPSPQIEVSFRRFFACFRVVPRICISAKLFSELHQSHTLHLLALQMTLYLRDSHGRHYGLIVEHSATVQLVRKQLGLTLQRKDRVSFNIKYKSQGFLFAPFIHKRIVTTSGKITTNNHT